MNKVPTTTNNVPTTTELYLKSIKTYIMTTDNKKKILVSNLIYNVNIDKKSINYVNTVNETTMIMSECSIDYSDIFHQIYESSDTNILWYKWNNADYNDEYYQPNFGIIIEIDILYKELSNNTIVTDSIVIDKDISKNDVMQLQTESSILGILNKINFLPKQWKDMYNKFTEKHSIGSFTNIYAFIILYYYREFLDINTVTKNSNWTLKVNYTTGNTTGMDIHYNENINNIDDLLQQQSDGVINLIKNELLTLDTNYFNIQNTVTTSNSNIIDNNNMHNDNNNNNNNNMHNDNNNNNMHNSSELDSIYYGD